MQVKYLLDSKLFPILDIMRPHEFGNLHKHLLKVAMKRNSADLSDDGDSDISPPVVFTLKDLSLRKNLMRFKKSEKNTEYISKLHIYNFFSVLYANVYLILLLCHLLLLLC